MICNSSQIVYHPINSFTLRVIRNDNTLTTRKKTLSSVLSHTHLLLHEILQHFTRLHIYRRIVWLLRKKYQKRSINLHNSNNIETLNSFFKIEFVCHNGQIIRP